MNLNIGPSFIWQTPVDKERLELLVRCNQVGESDSGMGFRDLERLKQRGQLLRIHGEEMKEGKLWHCRQMVP